MRSDRFNVAFVKGSHFFTEDGGSTLLRTLVTSCPTPSCHDQYDRN